MVRYKVSIKVRLIFISAVILRYLRYSLFENRKPSQVIFSSRFKYGKFRETCFHCSAYNLRFISTIMFVLFDIAWDEGSPGLAIPSHILHSSHYWGCYCAQQPFIRDRSDHLIYCSVTSDTFVYGNWPRIVSSI